MAKVKTKSEVTVYEVGGKEQMSSMEVRSHWNRSGFVELSVGKELVTVCASDLQKALNNCTNV